MPTVYKNLDEINKLQQNIMQFVQFWVKSEKTPIPQKEIIASMNTLGIKSRTALKAINSLLKKGYIRRAQTISNKSYYVQIKRI